MFSSLAADCFQILCACLLQSQTHVDFTNKHHFTFEVDLLTYYGKFVISDNNTMYTYAYKLLSSKNCWQGLSSGTTDCGNGLEFLTFIVKSILWLLRLARMTPHWITGWVQSSTTSILSTSSCCAIPTGTAAMQQVRGQRCWFYVIRFWLRNPCPRCLWSWCCGAFETKDRAIICTTFWKSLLEEEIWVMRCWKLDLKDPPTTWSSRMRPTMLWQARGWGGYWTVWLPWSAEAWVGSPPGAAPSWCCAGTRVKGTSQTTSWETWHDPLSCVATTSWRSRPSCTWSVGFLDSTRCWSNQQTPLCPSARHWSWCCSGLDRWNMWPIWGHLLALARSLCNCGVRGAMSTV